jgi:16S rRNA (adenine1518-N6/adenine1519-N6)-dimethyltransferase
MQHRPKKALGQNFLQDKNIQQKIVACLDQFSPNHVLEIGPGLGALTHHLLKKYSSLTLVEFDADIVSHWQKEGHQQAELIHSDILAVNLSQLQKQLSIIGNIPYNITSPILFHLFEHHICIDGAVLMMQKEVAERLAAKVSTKAYGILTVFSQFYGDVRYEFTVPSGVFFPKPKVDSAVISIQFKSDKLAQCQNIAFFKRLVRESFNKRRKMLRVSIKHLLPANGEEISFDLTRRPESLSCDDFIQLSNELYKYIK